ncbi:MAG: hypothetical protein JWO94_3238 [Verrucomicrobiaceae bacterium]|nr:hypothetical protein [Verrucomicrobiaceae bacterium]
MPELDINDDRLTRILKRVRRIELITRGLVKESLGGQYHSRFKGQGIEFDDFREYHAGDDVRFIDWNVTARMNAPFVRKYVEERELTVMLLVDVSGSGDYGSHDDSKRELAAELAAVFGFSACANQDKVGLVLFSDQVEAFVPPRKGLSHTLRIVRDILNVTPRSRRSRLQPALDIALQRIAHRSLIILVSDFLMPDLSWEQPLRGVAAKHDVTAVQVGDPREYDLPKAGRVCLQDPETGEQVVLDTSSPAVRLLYEQRIEEHFESVTQVFRRCGVEPVRALTGENYVPALRAYFRSRRKKR